VGIGFEGGGCVNLWAVSCFVEVRSIFTGPFFAEQVETLYSSYRFYEWDREQEDYRGGRERYYRLGLEDVPQEASYYWPHD